jgi:hypothetical protein
MRTMRTLTNVFLATAMLLCIRTEVQAQAYVPNSTTLPGNARFEVLLVTGSIYRTHVKLDRYTGEVWSWSYQNKKSIWIPTLVEEPPTNVKGASAPRFQIFAPLTVESSKTTILLDCQSGRTWDLALWKMEDGSPRWKWAAYGASE